MGRRPKKKEKSEKVDRKELEHRLCYAYAQCKSFCSVAKQFGLHPQQVKRAWEKLSPEEQTAILDTEKQVQENISRQIKKQLYPQRVEDYPSIEEMNQATLSAEAKVSKDFVENVMTARMLLGQELQRRCSNRDALAMMSNKNFSTLLRLVMSFTDGGSEEDNKQTVTSSTLERLQAEICNEIYSKKVN